MLRGRKSKSVFVLAIDYCLLLLLASCSSRPLTSASAEDGFHAEVFSFTTKDGKHTLTGTLILPSGFNATKKTLILVTPPGASSQAYEGLYTALSNVLVKHSIAVLTYNPRHLAETAIAVQAVTVFDQAEDAASAYAALKQDGRFGSIGLLGHSEGGNSVAVAAARNKNISFAVLLSPLGVSGVEFQLQQVQYRLQKMAEFVHLTHGKAPDPLQDQLIYSQMRKIHRIVANNDDVATAFSLIKSQNEQFYNKYHQQYPNLFGTAPIEMRHKRDSANLLTPHSMALIQFRPELYYPYITCPVLAMFGKMDEMVFWEENTKSLDSLINASEKQNYTLVALDSVDHNYRKVTDGLSRLLPPGVIVHQSPETVNHQDESFDTAAFVEIAKWVNEKSGS